MNDKKTEALKLALEALENHPGNYKLSKAECAEYRAVEDAIREALAEQPAQQQDPAYKYLLEQIRQMTAELAKFRAVSALALESLEDYRRSDDDRVSVAMGILQEALAEQPDPSAYWHNEFLKHNTTPEKPAQDQGQSCYCPECERLSKELDAIKAQQQEPVAKVCHAFVNRIVWNPDLAEPPPEGTELYTSPLVQQQELQELTAQRDQLADILTRTANALKGQPAELALHSWHDLPEVAQQLKEKNNG